MESQYEPLRTVEPHLAWGCWDITTLCLILVAGIYSALTVFEGVDVGQFSSLPKEIDKLKDKLAYGAIAVCISGCLVLILGTARPLRGGKGYDYKEHEPVSFGVAIFRSAEKIVALKEVAIAAGTMCFRLLADTLALIDLYDDADILAFLVKVSMMVVAASWAAMWVYPQTPTSWMYMPPLGLPSTQLSCLPCCVSLLALCQVLPVCLLLVGMLFFTFSDTSEELERPMEMFHVRQLLASLQKASLLTETVPAFLFNIFLLAGSKLSQTSWSLLCISTLVDGCFMVKTFAQIDCFGHVSHYVRNSGPELVEMKQTRKQINNEKHVKR